MLFEIIGIIIGWFVVGFIINIIFYNNVPQSLVGKNESAKAIHIIVNIITVILILRAILY